MSRQAAKGRADKGKGAQSTPNPAMQHEIIPGKFTEHDWNLAVTPSDNEDFVLGIVNEVVENAMGQIYEKYLERQLIPYTVSLAKDAILQIVEWNFLAHDEGEAADALISESWAEDEEPLSATIDSWGQGCIPKTAVTPRLSTPTMTPAAAIAEEVGEESETAPGEGEEEKSEEPEETEEAVAVPQEAAATSEKPETEASSEAATPAPAAGRRQFRFRPYRGKLRSAGLSAMSETLHDTELRLQATDSGAQPQEAAADGAVPDMPTSCLSILKVQAGRPPGNKEVIYDESGNVVSVVKISADKLPLHRVNVGYRVLQPELEAEKARLEALKKGIRVAGKPGRAPEKSRKSDARPPQAAPSQPAPDPKVEQLPPSLVETIDLAPGVSVKEAGVLRSGPPAARSGNERFAEIHPKGLRPVQARASQSHVPPGVAAADILPADRVVIKPPINMRPPIPPIRQSAR